MYILESILRKLIREVLKEYNPTEEEIVVRTVDDYFSDSNRRDLAVNQETRGKNEMSADFLARIRGPELIDEIEAFRKIINLSVVKKLGISDPLLKDFLDKPEDVRRLSDLKNLSDDDMKSVNLGLDFLFPDLFDYFDRYDLGEEERIRLVRIGNKIISDKKSMLNVLSNSVLNNLAEAGYYRTKKEITNIAILFLKALEENIA
tara:strand:- start:6575 stop:7186 length:612 start_codon:yes stop_codon:yes gene_type:complete